MRNTRGFTFIELMALIAIAITLLAAAVPYLLRARRSANQSSAIQSLRTIWTAQEIYRGKHQVYGQLTDLQTEGVIDANLRAGSHSLYAFTVTPSFAETAWTGTAAPQEDPAMMYYFVDDSGVIRQNPGAPADVTSPPVGN
jgi:type II secretory pathway pseudopilin PulG